MSQPHADSAARGHGRGHLAVLACAGVLALATCAPGLSADRTPEGDIASVPDIDASDPQAPPVPSLPDSRPVDGSGHPVDDEPDDGGSDRLEATEAVAEPDDEFAPVESQQPTVRLTGEEPAAADVVGAALDLDGVRFATSIRLGDLPVATSEGPTTVEVASVEPQGFRVFTPQVTADAEEVWQRVVDGDVALTHDTGRRLDVELGERLPAGGADERLRVGAFASNGVPPVAEGVLSRDAADELGFDGDLQVLVSLHDDADADAVADALAEVTGLRPEPIVPPETQQADEDATGQSSGGVPAGSREIEPFRYQSIGDGMIRIDPGWLRRHIVFADVPVLPGSVRCHRAMIPQLRAALAEVAERGLADEIRPGDYGGCWVPRHIMFDPGRNLSMHAWGLAIDLNVSTNQYGAEPQMDRRIVEIFEKWGFEWGGRWSTPDGMHFELWTLMDVPG